MKNSKLTILILLLLTLGLVGWGCFRKPAVNQNQNANANVVADEIDTSDWKTYRNEEYGFELRYPGEWEIDNEEKNIIKFWSAERLTIDHKLYPPDFLVKINLTNDNLNDWVNKVESNSGGFDIKENFNNGIYTYQRGLVDGSSTLFFKNENKKIILELTFYDDIYKNKIYKTIAESFTGDINTSDWKKYRNEKYEFEFSYPDEWEVSEPAASRFGGYYVEFWTKGFATTNPEKFPNLIISYIDLDDLEIKTYINRSLSLSDNDNLDQLIKDYPETISDRKDLLSLNSNLIKVVFKKDLHDVYSYFMFNPGRKIAVDFSTLIDAKKDSVFANIIKSFKFINK